MAEPYGKPIMASHMAKIWQSGHMPAAAAVVVAAAAALAMRLIKLQENLP